MNPRGNSLFTDRYVALRKATTLEHLAAASNAHTHRAH